MFWLKTVRGPIALVLLLAATGCLKTRSQLKEDESDAPQPAQIQEVQPQGQYVIDEIKSEIIKLTGRVEELERKSQTAAATAQTQASEELKKLESRITELEQAQAKMLEDMANASKPAANENIEHLNEAREKLAEGDLEGGVESLTEYLKFPKAKYAEEATFLRGEALFKLKEFRRSIVDLSKFPEKYPKSRRAPSALWLIAAAFEALGMKEEAKGFFQDLAEKYPKSAEGKKAKSRLK